MAENLGSVYAEVRVQLDKLQQDITKASALFKQINTQAQQTSTATSGTFSVMGKNIGSSFKSMSESGIGQFAKMLKGIEGAIAAAPIIGLITVIIGAVKKLVSGVADFLNETSEAYFAQQKTLTSLKTVVETTGASAWTSAGQLNSMAKALSEATGKSMNDITSMQTRILTYTNIIGENFDRTQKAALDMAAVMGMDLSSAAETLGKALDAPDQGLVALTRQGFRFSDQLKDQVKELTAQGRLFEAQGLILQEVEGVYNGVAEATSAAEGNTARLKNITEQLNVEHGRSSSAITEWWRNTQIAAKENRLLELQVKNGMKEIAASSGVVSNLDKQILELRTAMQSGAEGAEEMAAKLARLTAQRDTITGDLGRIRKTIDTLQAQMRLFSGEGIFGDTMGDTILNSILHPIQAVRANIQVITGMATERSAMLQDEITRLSRMEYLYNQISIQVTKRREVERAVAHEQEGYKAQLDAVDEATRKRASILSDIREQERAGLIDYEEAQKRREAAFRDEASAMFSAGQSLEDLQRKLDAQRIDQINNIRKISIETADQIRSLYNEGMFGDPASAEAIEEQTRRLVENSKQAETVIKSINDRYTKQANSINQVNKLRQEALNAEKAISDQRARTTANEKASEQIANAANEQKKKNLQDIITLSTASDEDRKKASEELLRLEQQLSVEALKKQSYYTDLLKGLEQGTAEYREAKEIQDKMIEDTEKLIALKYSDVDAQNQIHDTQLQIALLDAKRVGDTQKQLEIERQIAAEALHRSSMYQNAGLASQKELDGQLGIVNSMSEQMNYAQALQDQSDQIAMLSLKKKKSEEEIIQLLIRQGTEQLKQQSFWKYLTEEQQKEMIANMEEIIRLSNSDGGTFWDTVSKKINKVMGEVQRYGQEAANVVSAAYSYMATMVQRSVDVSLEGLKNVFDADMDTMKTRHNLAADLMEEDHKRQIELMKERQEEEERIFDERYDLLMEDLTRRMEAELFAAGLINAKSEEDAETELERAKASLNQREILQAQNTLKRIQIENKYAAEEKALQEKRAREEKALEEKQAAEEKELAERQKAETKAREEQELAEKSARELAYNRKKAQLEYQAAMAQWQLQLINAISSAALAVVMAGMNMWPVPAIPMMAAAGIAGGIGVATVASNPPRLRQFAQGGIVPGNSFSGDRIPILANSGERILTRAQNDVYEDLMAEPEGSEDQLIHVSVKVVLDSTVIAEGVAEVFNDGLVTIIGNRAIR